MKQFTMPIKGKKYKEKNMGKFLSFLLYDGNTLSEITVNPLYFIWIIKQSEPNVKKKNVDEI